MYDGHDTNLSLFMYPDDMLKAVGANHKRFWYLDVHARGIIPGYMKSFFKRQGYDLDLTQEDLEALKHGCVDYIGFSYYMSFATKGDGNINLDYDEENDEDVYRISKKYEEKGRFSRTSFL